MKKTFAKLGALLLATTMVLTSCQFPFQKDTITYKEKNQATDTVVQQGMSKEDAAYAAVDYLKTMSVEEKVGQLFVVNLELLDPTRGSYYEYTKITKRMKETLEKYHVGGVIFFSRNIANRKQTHKLIRKLQKYSKMPLFVTVDEEGGDVARIGCNPKMKTTTFPTIDQIGKTKDADYVYNMGATIGQEIKKLGFNVDFAPVADVKTSDLNKEIGTRSFGADEDKVANMVSAFVTGIQKQGVSATLKHFPGQGSSEGDTHNGDVNIDSGIAKLRKVDFKPFEAGIEAGADFIMVSHISVSKVTESSIPASMSKLMMTTILRDELEYDGLILTDALDMASITDHYTSAQAAYGCFKAGSDLILMPENLKEAYNTMLAKATDGGIEQDRLDSTVLRILQLKFERGILTEEDLQQAKITPTPPTKTPTPKKAKKAKKGKKNGKKAENKAKKKAKKK